MKDYNFTDNYKDDERKSKILNKIKKIYLFYFILLIFLLYFFYNSVFWISTYFLYLIFYGLYNPYTEITIENYNKRFILSTIVFIFLIFFLKILF